MMWKPGTAKPDIQDFVNNNHHNNDRKRSHSTDSHHHRRRIKAEEQKRDIKEHTIKPTTGAVSQLSNGTRNMRFMQRNKSLSPSKSHSLSSSSSQPPISFNSSSTISTTFHNRQQGSIQNDNEMNTKNKPIDMDVDENNQSDDSENDDSSDDDDVLPMQTTNHFADTTKSNSVIQSEDNVEYIKGNNKTAVTSIMPCHVDSDEAIKNNISLFAKSITKQITSSSSSSLLSTPLPEPMIASSSDMYGISGIILGRRSFGGFNKYVAENHYYSSLYVKEMMPFEDNSNREMTSSDKKKKKKKKKHSGSLSDNQELSSLQKNMKKNNDDDNDDDDNIDFKDYNDMERHNKKKKKYGN